MATEEWIKRAILNNKQYEDLPARVRTVFPVAEYRLKCGPGQACCRSRAVLHNDSVTDSVTGQRPHSVTVCLYDVNANLCSWLCQVQIWRVLPDGAGPGPGQACFNTLSLG